MVHSSKFSLGIRSMSVSWSPSQFCLWQCGWPFMLEAFFDGVGFLERCALPSPLHSDPSQAASAADIVPVEFCYLLPGGVRADELHGGRFCHQVLFCRWFPSATMDCMVMLTLACGSGMEEHHLLIWELMVKPTTCPLLMFLDVSISIQPPLHFHH